MHFLRLLTAILGDSSRRHTYGGHDKWRKVDPFSRCNGAKMAFGCALRAQFVTILTSIRLWFMRFRLGIRRTRRRRAPLPLPKRVHRKYIEICARCVFVRYSWRDMLSMRLAVAIFMINGLGEIVAEFGDLVLSSLVNRKYWEIICNVGQGCFGRVRIKAEVGESSPRHGPQ